VAARHVACLQNVTNLQALNLVQALCILHHLGVWVDTIAVGHLLQLLANLQRQ
jgi:hypothetical protein